MCTEGNGEEPTVGTPLRRLIGAVTVALVRVGLWWKGRREGVHKIICNTASNRAPTSMGGATHIVGGCVVDGSVA